MSRKQSKLLIAGLLAVINLLSVPVNAGTSPVARPDIKVEHGELRFSVPIYESKLREFPHERIEFDIQVMKDLKRLVMKLTDDCLAEKKPWFRRNRQQDFYKLFKGTQSKLRELHHDGVGPALKYNFAWELITLWHDVRTNANEQLKLYTEMRQKMQESAEMSKQTDIQSMSKLMDGLIEVVTNSPVGFYLKWSELEVNERPFVKFAANYVNLFKYHGCQSEIRMVDAAINRIERKL